MKEQFKFRLTPSELTTAMGVTSHVSGLYVMLEPDKLGGTIWEQYRRQKGMIALEPSQMRPPKRSVLVIQDCKVRGAAEWDVANRWKAKGVVQHAEVVGKRIVMHCRLGEGKLRFGPSANVMGAQGLEAILLEGEEGGEQETLLRLRWRGLAGAGLGLAHGLAASPGVLYTDYPKVSYEEGLEGLKVGGDREVVVETVVPRLTRLMVGLDDTDTPHSGATWSLGEQLKELIEKDMKGATVLDQRLIQLWPGVEEKTSNCVALGLSLAVHPEMILQVKDIICDFIASKVESPEAGLAFFEGITVPGMVQEFCHMARRERVSLEQARKVSTVSKMVLEPVVGKRGLIGALAAIGGLDMGPEVAMVAL